MAGIFKQNDIRGVYGAGLTEDVVFQVGRAFSTLVDCEKVAVGRDMRSHSASLFDALVSGLTLQGVGVLDLGMCSTPMLYFATGHLGLDAGIMITASHNPGQYNGLKLCREQAIPVSWASGIADLERMVNSQSYGPQADTPGAIMPYDIAPEYAAHIQRFAALSRPICLAADFAHGMGLVEHDALEGLLETHGIHAELDGSFPAHEANPLLVETYTHLQREMETGRYDFGVYYDGDGDRVGFTDEVGRVISMDLITALLAQEILVKAPGKILYDLRSSRAVKEVIEELGGEAIMTRVGHAYIKEQMRETGALFGGELSGHYYFRENYCSESAALAVLTIANMVSASGCPLSTMVEPLRIYTTSGELNYPLRDAERMFDRIRSAFSAEHLFDLDGLSGAFDDGWFNVRVSNTESFVRLNVGAITREKMALMRDHIQEIILRD